MKMKWFALALCLGLLAGCGGKDQTAPSESPEPTAQVENTPIPAPVLATPEPTPEPLSLGAYAAKVREISHAHSDAQFDLIYIDEDDVPELVGSWSDGWTQYATIYALDRGSAVLVHEGWTTGRLGVPMYAPRQNVILESNSEQAGALWYNTFYRLDSNHKPVAFRELYEDMINGTYKVDGRTATEAELRQASIDCTASLSGTMTADAILQLLGSEDNTAAAQSAGGDVYYVDGIAFRMTLSEDVKARVRTETYEGTLTFYDRVNRDSGYGGDIVTVLHFPSRQAMEDDWDTNQYLMDVPGNGILALYEPQDVQFDVSDQYAFDTLSTAVLNAVQNIQLV